jgi:hypothetical protein
VVSHIATRDVEGTIKSINEDINSGELAAALDSIGLKLGTTNVKAAVVGSNPSSSYHVPCPASFTKTSQKFAFPFKCKGLALTFWS